jgi:predicted transcriptional regulator
MVTVMNIKVDIPADVQRRVAAIARRTGLSESEVVTEALEHGHSLDWQEQFAAKVAQGIEAADRGEFASRTDIERIRSKYRPS